MPRITFTPEIVADPNRFIAQLHTAFDDVVQANTKITTEVQNTVSSLTTNVTNNTTIINNSVLSILDNGGSTVGSRSKLQFKDNAPLSFALVDNAGLAAVVITPSLAFNATNLKLTAGALNTIQDIAPSSSPTFTNLTTTLNATVQGDLEVQNNTLLTGLPGNGLLYLNNAQTVVQINDVATGKYLGSAGTTSTPTWNSTAALTKVDDTNVTLTLGGTPASSLFNAVSLTLGWTGTLADGRLSTTAVTPGSYGSATQTGTFTVSATGRLTAAANVTITPAASSITGTQTLTAGPNLQFTAGTGVGAVLVAGTLDTIQGIRATDAPTFAGLNLNGDVVLNELAGYGLLYIPDTKIITQINNVATGFYLGSAGATNVPVWTAYAALTRTNDTNVTLTLGGSPGSSLLQAASLTLGWTGTLAAGRLNANVVQSITNDTNVTGSISAQNLTLGWTGTLADGRLSTTAVVAGSYGSATQVGTFTVSATGRLTAASNVTITPAASSITGAHDLTLGPSLGFTGGSGVGALLVAATVDTAQDIRVSASPTFVAMELNGGNLDLLGPATGAQTIIFEQADGLIDFKAPASLTTSQTITLPELTGTVFLTNAGQTITSAIWHGTAIAEIYGGTNQTTYTLGDILYASAANTLSKLAGNTTGTKKFLRQTGTGTVSAAPAWDTVVAADVGSGATLTAGNSLQFTAGTGAAAVLVAGTLDTIQDIRTTATPQWTRLGIGTAAVSGISILAQNTATQTANMIDIRSGASPAYAQVRVSENSVASCIDLLSFTADNDQIGFDVDWFGASWLARHAAVAWITKTSSKLQVQGSTGNTIGSAATQTKLFEWDLANGNISTFLGKFTQYNNISTVSNGVPAEYATVDLTTQAAATGTVTLYAVPAAGAGQYRLCWNAKITRAATSSSTLGALTIVYTDPDGTVVTITAPAAIVAGTFATTSTANTTGTALLGFDLFLNCKASTNITYSFAYASTGGTSMQYNLHIKLEALG